jgi:purine-binding chemotaxis protein CheW
VNEHTCRIFGLPGDEFLKHTVLRLYADRQDRKKLVNIVKEKGYVNNFQVCLKKADDSLLWAALFSQPMKFSDEDCILTVVYDLTERRQAEEEIRRLTEELEKSKEREEKYLIFTLAGQEYGIPLMKIKEIIGMMPIAPVPNMPDFIRGVANLRGRVIAIADIRLGLEAADDTERTCIIISEIESKAEKRTAGIIVDAVNEVAGIKGKHIEPPPKFEFDRKTDLRFISGMAKIGEDIKILVDIGILWEEFLNFA